MLAAIVTLPDKNASSSASGRSGTTCRFLPRGSRYIASHRAQRRAEMTEMSETAEHEYADRIAGWALILGALLSMFAMAHHPEHVDPNGLVGIVHGAMLILMAATA